MSISTPIEFVSFICKLLFMICISAGLLAYTLTTLKSVHKNWIHLQKLHQIPCNHCIFFTGEYNLKCAVHPCKALSEEAIGCADYQMAKKSLINGNKI
jgi:hypothetical protein